jgi:hypothetical protein
MNGTRWPFRHWVRPRILAFVDDGPYQPEAPASALRNALGTVAGFGMHTLKPYEPEAPALMLGFWNFAPKGQ